MGGSWRRLGAAGLVALGCALAPLAGAVRADPGRPPVLVEPGGEVWAPVSAETLAAMRAPLPAVSAPSYAAADAETGQLLFSAQANRARPMASLTKIMTAILALETGSLDQVVPSEVDYRKLGDSSVMGLLPGERLTLEELLYGLLLPSGNDAAIAIARGLAGSEAAFVARMNARATELGLTETHFANVHGLDEPEHYSSPADLLTMTRVAMANSVFRRIVATPARTIQGQRATYRLENTNELLGQTPGVDGVKTGSTDGCGLCLVVSVQRQGHRVFLSLLGSRDRFGEANRLIDALYDRFTWPEARPISAWGDQLLRASGRQLPPAGAPLAAIPNWQARLLTSEVWPTGDTGAWYRLWAAGEPLVNGRPAP